MTNPLTKQSIQNAPTTFGVYLILDGTDGKGKVLYVGKAINLKKRLNSYFASNLAIKTRQLMREACSINTIITASENASLLLEDVLIKKHLPKFNILLRDDKSYPYIWFSGDKFSALGLHHRKISKNGQYFGPYISKGTLRYSLDLLEKTFQLRTCSNATFNSRQKPCLKHQIHCCSAPCVGLISQEEYAKNIKQAKNFLSNADFSIIKTLSKQMQQSAELEQFELAALLRNKITKLRHIQQQYSQSIVTRSKNVDIWGISINANLAFIHLLMVRQGKVQDSLPFRVQQLYSCSATDVLTDVIKQYYLSLPAEHLVTNIIIPQTINEQQNIAISLNAKLPQNKINKCKINLRTPKNNRIYKGWVQMATANATLAADNMASKKDIVKQQFAELATKFGLKTVARVECFDVSHFSGANTVCSMVVCTKHGLQKKDYRIFNIKTAKASDDYAATFEAINRRFAYIKGSTNYKATTNKAISKAPHILVIDGGIGQINMAIKALRTQAIKRQFILGIAKGVTRKAEFERYFVCHYKHKQIDKVEEVHFTNPPFILQTIRNKAHDFAINASRKQLAKTNTSSTINTIAGIGKQKQQQLLIYFGSMANLKQATIADIRKVPGIGKVMAKNIYDAVV